MGPRRGAGWVLALLALAHWWAAAVEASHAVYESPRSAPPAAAIGSELRTGYHFRPPRNWINDPNGPMYYNGVYHLFYQYNPNGSVWGNIIWAHSVSTDLINWEALEPAIYPTIPSDINGCWSGSATILPGNRPVIMYTGIDPQNRQVQNVAYPKNLTDTYLREWVKPDYNPVIAPGSGINASAFRDPTTAWRGGGHWKLVVGSKWNKKGEAILYRSRDFVRWVKAKHSLHAARDTGMWECPDFYPVALRGQRGLDTSAAGGSDVKHILKVSLDLTRYEYYTIGTYDHVKDKYVPDGTSPDDHTGLRYDYGNFYASKTFFDPKKNRRILWGWANESDTVDDDKAKGWAGIQAIPRTIWLSRNGRQLMQWPIEELESLRSKHIVVQNTQVPSGGFFEVQGIDSSQVDVEVTFEVTGLEKAEAFDPSWTTNAEALCGQKRANVRGGAGPFGLHVLASVNMEERTSVFFIIFQAQTKYKVLMCHDPTRSTLRPNIYKPTFAGFVDVDIPESGKISLRSLIDHSVVESFGAGGTTCITSRVYPSTAIGRNAHLFVFNNGLANVKVSKLEAWEMKRPFMNGA
ncbi:beta-fructofuranosidase, insoluble isoenzyme 3-like [Zingiber officinale]|uniref:beta-fructofuranosidase, insoluble isoenzyme 3-like n=1 Tax=Zingiber officinale TaxID=94328 RepID=UPI001C4DC25C|nr:beta-fructofuranosidase, insoluble isoenzyme 3-like [Zingiber officinale]